MPDPPDEGEVCRDAQALHGKLAELYNAPRGGGTGPLQGPILQKLQRTFPPGQAQEHLRLLRSALLRVEDALDEDPVFRQDVEEAWQRLGLAAKFEFERDQPLTKWLVQHNRSAIPLLDRVFNQGVVLLGEARAEMRTDVLRVDVADVAELLHDFFRQLNRGP
jgi:hypothetical protein